MYKLPKQEIVQLNNVSEDPTARKNILFILAGIEGHCEALRDLAETLAYQNTLVYGLEYTSNVPCTSIQDSARFYLEKIFMKLRDLGETVFHLAGYSYGGIIAIEIAHILEIKNTKLPKIQSLILFESSHQFFKVGVHVNAKKLNCQIPNKDIFARNYIYTAPLSSYLTLMIGRPDLRYELYSYLKENSMNLDDGLEKAFKYLMKRSLIVFEDNEELKEMMNYLKIALLKSNAAFIYEYDTLHKLDLPVVLMKSRQFLYKDLKDLFVNVDYESVEQFKLEFNKINYNLNEISSNLEVIEFSSGNHWTFISENCEQISTHLARLFKSKNLISKL